MTQKAAILALVDEHERALRHLLNMMNNWMDESLNVPVGEEEQKTVKDVLVHLLRSIYTSYFGWMQEKLGVSSFVQSPDESLLLKIEELAGWKQALHDCIDYMEQATAEIVDDDLGKAYPAAWNNNESYMIEQMFEHAIVHVWRHCRQLERRMPVHRVRQYVHAFDDSLEPIVFSRKTRTSEEAANVLGVEVGQIAKSILFRSDDQFGLFVAAGDVRVNQNRVKQLLGGKKSKMATPQEVVEVTGYQVGAVCPFALATSVPVFLDKSMSRFDRIYTAAGTAESVLPITFERLCGITGGTVTHLDRGQEQTVQ